MQRLKNINSNFPKKLPLRFNLNPQQSVVGCEGEKKKKEKKKLSKKSIDFFFFLFIALYSDTLHTPFRLPVKARENFNKRLKIIFVERLKNNVFVNFCISCIINCVSVGVLAQ